MANIISDRLAKAKQSLTNVLAETPIITRMYTLMVPFFTGMAIAGGYVSQDFARLMAPFVWTTTTLNAIAGASAVNHYKNHGSEVHFDNCEKKFCLGYWAKKLEERFPSLAENGAEDGR